MYLHLGQNTVVPFEEIIGVFDLDTATVGRSTRNYLGKAEKNGEVVNVSYELPKSFIVCSAPGKKNKKTVYISQISSSTLRKRTAYIDSISNVKQILKSKA